MSALVRVERLSKTYPGGWRQKPVQVLDDISFEVAQGEVFGFIGPNGAGKSTTIKILLGLVQSSGGSATLFGRSVDDPESRRGLGYVSENPSFPDYLSPLEILRMAVGVSKVSVVDPVRHCQEWLDKFGIGNVANKLVRGFSKGMVQRTALAHALALKPRLLILDEPLSGLDPLGRRDVVDILAAYRRDGGTIFLTSHVLHDVERLADRFGLIHQGRLRSIQSPAQIVGDGESLLVRTMGEQALAGMSEDAPGRWFIEVPRGELWDRLEAIRQANHVLLEVKPTLSLEHAFLRATRPGGKVTD